MLKATAGASVSAAVWAEPTIRGLARRPAYASATSQAIVTSFAGNASFPGGAGASETLATQTFNGVTVTLTLSGSGTDWALTASTSDPSCTCTITGGSATATARLFFFDFATGTTRQITGALDGGAFNFTLPLSSDGAVFSTRITEVVWDLDVTCV